MSPIIAGDRVVEITNADFCTCPNSHSEEDGWMDSTISSVQTVESVHAEPNGCVMLAFLGLPDDEYCAGYFRKIEPADPAFISLIKKKVLEDA